MSSQFSERAGVKECIWIARRDIIGLLAISLITLAASIVVQPTDNIPLIDDWTYAWSVEHFMTTGELRVLDWSAHYPLAQIIWAALFTHTFGFSFFTLRVSTLVLCWIGLLANYLTLRTVGINPFNSTLATLTLLFNPVFFVLSYSFMTDVPFVGAMNLAILCYVLWVKRRTSSYLCLGGIFAIASFLIRQIGALLLLIPLVYILLSRVRSSERRALSWRELLFLFFPFLLVGLTIWWIRNIHGPTSVYLDKAETLHYVFSASWWLSSRSWSVVLHGTVDALVHSGLLLFPLGIAAIWGRPKRLLLGSLAFVAFLTCLYVWHFGKTPNLLEFGETLSLQELGASRPLLPDGKLLKPQMASWVAWILIGFSLFSIGAIIACLLEQIRNPSRWMSHTSVIIAINGFLQFSAVEALWLYYDRYYLPFLPGMAALAISCLKQTRIVKAVMVAGVLMYGAISISGTIDNLRFNGAVADARKWVLGEGVAPSQIDAGYVLNGWWLYAHPENLPPGARPETDVPSVTSSVNLPYRITNSSMPSYEVVRVLTWRSIWAASDRVYVLRKMPIGSSKGS